MTHSILIKKTHDEKNARRKRNLSDFVSQKTDLAPTKEYSSSLSSVLRCPLAELATRKSRNALMIGLTLSAFVLPSCSTVPHQGNKNISYTASTQTNMSNSWIVKRQLLSQYKKWQGTPYKWGGTTLNGIDCSAFVQRTYAEKFGYKLTRTTRTQVKQGERVAKADLQIGDVIFFKTGTYTRHNGIYLGNNEFIHASSSRGIAISNLKRPYWQKRYWTTRRMG